MLSPNFHIYLSTNELQSNKMTDPKPEHVFLSRKSFVLFTSTAI